MHLSFLFNFFIFKMCICSIYKILAFSFGSVFSCFNTTIDCFCCPHLQVALDKKVYQMTKYKYIYINVSHWCLISNLIFHIWFFQVHVFTSNSPSHDISLMLYIHFKYQQMQLPSLITFSSSLSWHVKKQMSNWLQFLVLLLMIDNTIVVQNSNANIPRINGQYIYISAT